MILSYSLDAFRQRQNNKSGFTLLELLIVMTVIGALSAIALVSFPAVSKRARDTQRKSDLKQYQTLMELYANKTGSYLTTSGNLTAGTNCTSLGAEGCPDDPGPFNYKVDSAPTQYHMWAELELPTSGCANTSYFLLCSNGVAKDYCGSAAPDFGDCN